MGQGGVAWAPCACGHLAHTRTLGQSGDSSLQVFLRAQNARGHLCPHVRGRVSGKICPTVIHFFCETFPKVIKPLFIIHDALVIDVNLDRESHIKSEIGDYYKHDSLGTFPWKVRRV